MSYLSELLKEGYLLKERMTADKARLAAINAELVKQATFKDGCKTGRIAADGILCKVQLKETVSWDQAKLNDACKAMGSELFSKAFGYEFKPHSAKILSEWLAQPKLPDEYREMILGAKTVKPAAHSVSIEKLED